MPVRTRAVLDALPTYRPGRTPADIARELGLPSAIRLASNELPLGPLPSVRAAIAEAAEEVNRYPDFHRTGLRGALADRLGVSSAEITASAGSVALLNHLVQTVVDPGSEVVFAWRSFEAYLPLTLAAGATPVKVPLVEQTHDLEAMAAAVTDRTRLVLVCNPNNPTGTAVGRAELEKFLDAVPSDVLIVLDEAYVEFSCNDDVPDGLELAAGRDNVAVLRTFSKAYGLAGLRVGYCVSSTQIADCLRKVQLQFGVNAIADAAAQASLRPDADRELADRVAAVVGERNRVSAALRELGVVLPQSEANFVYLPLGADSAPFAAACENRGVIVRPYPGDGVRVTIGLPAENDAFLAAAAEAFRP